MSLVSYYHEVFKPIVEGMFTPTCEAIAKLGIRPNHITALQFPVSAAMCYYLLQGNIQAGLLLIILVLTLDFFDGSVARINGQESRLGHFLDKGADLFGIILLLVGIAAYSSLTMNLCIALGIINVLLYITNEIREPFFYSCTRTAGGIGLLLLMVSGEIEVLNFWIIVSVCVGGFLLLRKSWIIARK